MSRGHLLALAVALVVSGCAQDDKATVPEGIVCIEDVAKHTVVIGGRKFRDDVALETEKVSRDRFQVGILFTNHDGALIAPIVKVKKVKSGAFEQTYLGDDWIAAGGPIGDASVFTSIPIHNSINEYFFLVRDIKDIQDDSKWRVYTLAADKMPDKGEDLEIPALEKLPWLKDVKDSKAVLEQMRLADKVSRQLPEP